MRQSVSFWREIVTYCVKRNFLEICNHAETYRHCRISHSFNMRCYFQFFVQFQLDLIVHELEEEKLGNLAVHHRLMRLYTTALPVVVRVYQLLSLYSFINTQLVNCDWVRVFSYSFVNIVYTFCLGPGWYSGSKNTFLSTVFWDRF